MLGEKRVGHAGTLDPDATGVLLLGVGRFTRMLRFLSAATKSYEGEVVLGTATSTLDSSGEVTATWDMSGVTHDDVQKAVLSLTGAIEQVPPMVSAVKVGGRRLHELAREGVVVERSPRQVRIDRFEIEPALTPGAYRISVDCSAGTYIRTLASDLGEALGGGAHLRNLRRTRVGSFGLGEAAPLSAIDATCIITPARALRDLAQVEVDSEVSRLVLHGLPLDKIAVGATGEGPWAIVDRHGELLATYEQTETDRIVPAVVLGSLE